MFFHIYKLAIDAMNIQVARSRKRPSDRDAVPPKPHYKSTLLNPSEAYLAPAREREGQTPRRHERRTGRDIADLVLS